MEGTQALLTGTVAEAVIADRAYDAGEWVIEPLQQAGKQGLSYSAACKIIDRYEQGGMAALAPKTRR
ncbi:hypothetical protein FHR87_003548 [Azomonas macrocytogenes]|uniref:Uncharacterized protein n=1 Tax=Azomonas macrocytogenes TaxID=69962 RepID=A0A839TAC9_AZOMA|nr:hypothetical protein [Azomonas macrocytogenes]